MRLCWMSDRLGCGLSPDDSTGGQGVKRSETGMNQSVPVGERLSNPATAILNLPIHTGGCSFRL